MKQKDRDPENDKPADLHGLLPYVLTKCSAGMLCKDVRKVMKGLSGMRVSADRVNSFLTVR